MNMKLLHVHSGVNTLNRLFRIPLFVWEIPTRDTRRILSL
jgi:hypothetical protein